MSNNSTNVTIAGLSFLCVPLRDADFKDIAAIYVILCVGSDGSWKVLDVGQSGELGTRIDNHDRRACWEKNCPSGNIWVCIYKMPSDKYTKKDREELEKKIREANAPVPCGKK